MALTEETKLDLITVTGNNVILVRYATNIMRDGQVINSSYHRTSFEPWMDLTGQDERIINVAAAVWTPEIIAAAEAARSNPLPT